MLMRIRNKYLRRFLVIAFIPPAYLLFTLLGALAGVAFFWEKGAEAVTDAWKGSQ